MDHLEEKMENESLQLKEDEEAYEELKLAGYDFFSTKYFHSEEDKQAIKELASGLELVPDDNFQALAMCSTPEGVEYMQKQILSKAKGRRVIEGKGNGKGGGFMRTRG